MRYFLISYLMTLTGQPAPASAIDSDSLVQLGWLSMRMTLVVSVTWKTSGEASSQASQTMQPGMIQTLSTVPRSGLDALPPTPLSTTFPSRSDPPPAGAATGAGAGAPAAGAAAAGFGAGLAAGFSCLGFAFGFVTRFSGWTQSTTCATRL